jgi:D-arabinitol dehydrogenase (NADP+)
MKAVVYSAPGALDLAELTVPTPGRGEVRVRCLITGICGTDAHIHDGEFGAQFPLIPGHEIVGEVDAVGPDISRLTVGDRVAVDPCIFCGQCDECRQGRALYCENLNALGIDRPGGFAEFCLAREKRCYPVGDLDLETAALVEPTACVVHGLDQLGLAAAGTVLITGAGPTSQIFAQALASSGATHITMAAPTPFKLDVARANGVHNTVQLDRHDFAASLPELQRIAPRGFDCVIEATGSPAILSHTAALTRRGGTVLVYGMAREDATAEILPYEVFRKELTIRGSFSQSFCFERAIRLLRSGRVRADGIVTHRYGLDEFPAALASLRDPQCLKAVVLPSR